MNQTARWLYETTEVVPDDIADPVELLGGKGASLRKLAAAGFRVPSGFTITTAACRYYFEFGRQSPPGLMEQVIVAVERMERESKKSYGRPPSPLLLAVRSGAAVSMPGMLATILNCGLSLSLAEALSDSWTWDAYADLIRQLASTQGVELMDPAGTGAVADRQAACRRLLLQYESARGVPFPQDRWELLRKSINAVFDSWRNPRAEAFRNTWGGDPETGTAVTVQIMQQTDVAGVLFSHDPRDRSGDELLIEAVQGSGQRLVDGTTTPQRFRVDRRTPSLCAAAGRDTHSTVGAKPVERCDGNQGIGLSECLLNETQLGELGHLGIRLEQYFGQPLDVEWGYSQGEIVVFQVRPLASGTGASLEKTRAHEVRRLKRLAAVHGTRLWVRHNLSETLPSPTPLTWDIVRRFMSGSGGFGRLYRQLGYRPSPRVCRHGFLDLIAGRIYADPDRVAEMFGAQTPLRYDLDALRRDPALIDRAPTHFAPEKTDSRFLIHLPGLVWSLLRSSWRLKHGLGRVAERFDQEIVPAYVAYLQSERQLDLAALSDADVVRRLEDRRVRVLDEFAAEALRPGLLGALAFTILDQWLTGYLGPEDGGRLGRALITGLETPTGEVQQAMLHRVAMGEITVADFLRRFGHRGPGEMELSAPRWNEMPDAISQAADRLRREGTRDPREMLAEAASQRARTAEELSQRLRNCGASSLYPQIHQQLLFVQRLLPYREIAKDYLMMGYELIRQAIGELARRFRLGRDVYFLRWNEVTKLSSRSDPAPRKIERRRRRWYLSQRLSLYDTIDVQQIDELGLTRSLPDGGGGDDLCGLSLSNGVAQGPVRVARESAHAFSSGLTHVPTGHVLVCPAIDPCFTPMLLQASGLIVERGGILSHGAIVARQLGIPAVAVAGAVDKLRDGEMVIVDGNRGIVARHRGGP